MVGYGRVTFVAEALRLILERWEAVVIVFEIGVEDGVAYFGG